MRYVQNAAIYKNGGTNGVAAAFYRVTEFLYGSRYLGAAFLAATPPSSSYRYGVVGTEGSAATNDSRMAGGAAPTPRAFNRYGLSAPAGSGIPRVLGGFFKFFSRDLFAHSYDPSR